MTPTASASAALPWPRLVRSGDPDTSRRAAQRVAKASGPAIEAVRRVMRSGNGFTDQEIHLWCRDAGYRRSLSTIQHARLALVERGELRDSGEERLTVDGCMSRVWVRTGDQP